MSSRVLTIAALILIVLAGVGLQGLSSREGSRVPPFGAVLSWVMRTWTGRVGVLAAWAWLGFHFFGS
jgi:hypothetical protein